MKKHYVEGLQTRSYGLASQCHLNTPVAFHCVNKEIHSKKIKKYLSLQHYISIKKAIKPSNLWQISQNRTKKGLFFKYQCLFWSSFGTVQAEGSMNGFDHNFKFFSCGGFF